jgi:mannose-1-phosphate guanylyltransferase/mannose-6-phosphate isomerase
LITPVILCGGVGSRLYPLSTPECPKQFLRLNHDKYSLLQQTVLRVSGAGFFKPILVANIQHEKLVHQHLQEIDAQADIIFEPEGRGTAASIIAASLFALRQNIEHKLLVLPSDHAIDNIVSFKQTMRKAAAQLSDKIIIFGIKPEYAATIYGYIQANNHYVERFVEKPNHALAEQFVAEGNYYWNSGIFMFDAQTLLREITTLNPALLRLITNSFEHAEIINGALMLQRNYFLQSENISFDVAVMERIKGAVMFELNSGWSDLGSFAALEKLKYLPQNQNNDSTKLTK